MSLPFDEAKTTQAAALFLRLRGGQMSYMKLIKLLYLADRASLLRFGKPITMDRWFSMKHGPVLSNVLSLITDPSRDSDGPWPQFISPPLGNREVRLLAEAPCDRLSPAEEKVIAEIFEQYGHYGRWDLVDLLHQESVLPEWKEPSGSGRTPITLLDILTTEMNREEAMIAEFDLKSMVQTSAHRSDL